MCLHLLPFLYVGVTQVFIYGYPGTFFFYKYCTNLPLFFPFFFPLLKRRGTVSFFSSYRRYGKLRCLRLPPLIGSSVDNVSSFLFPLLFLLEVSRPFPLLRLTNWCFRNRLLSFFALCVCRRWDFFFFLFFFPPLLESFVKAIVFTLSVAILRQTIGPLEKIFSPPFFFFFFFPLLPIDTSFPFSGMERWPHLPVSPHAGGAPFFLLPAGGVPFRCRKPFHLFFPFFFVSPHRLRFPLKLGKRRLPFCLFPLMASNHHTFPFFFLFLLRTGGLRSTQSVSPIFPIGFRLSPSFLSFSPDVARSYIFSPLFFFPFLPLCSGQRSRSSQ